VQAGRHGVVHEVVGGGDRVEDGPDAGGFCRGGDGFVA